MQAVEAWATFNEEISPTWGSFTPKSQFSSTRRDTPSPSLPITSAILPLRFDCQMRSEACSVAAATQKPSSFRRSMVLTRFATWVTGM